MGNLRKDCDIKMKYYRVNSEVHDKLTFRDSVVGEILTVKERKNFFPTIADKCFDTVTVKKTETYVFFCTRFPIESAHVIVLKQGACI